MTDFEELVNSLGEQGLARHRDTLITNSKANSEHVVETIRAVPKRDQACLIISAGPSLYRENMLARIHSKFNGTIVAVDAAYVACLRAGIVPDYVLTLDPHPTRVVRWFGDPQLADHMNGDDYFERQDLDIAFRENAEERNKENIYLVDRYKVPLVIATCAPAPVVSRTTAHRRFWFAPLVDDPDQADSVTRQMVETTEALAMNTGGCVGNAAWVFAHSILGSKNIAIVGADFGYYEDTPLEQTQSWHMLKGQVHYYPMETNPDGQKHYTDVTYFWYRQNLRDLLDANDATIVNCSGAGLLYGERVKWQRLEEWLNDL